MKRILGYKTFNEYLTDEQIYEFVKRFKSVEVNSQDFDDRKCTTKLDIFKAFRYGLDKSGINIFDYLRPEHFEISTYKANFLALEESFQIMSDSHRKCRAYINKLKKIVGCKCVDPSKPLNTSSDLPDDIYYFGELLLALHSRSAFLQAASTYKNIQKKMEFAKKNLKKQVAFFHTLNSTKKQLCLGDEVVKVDHLKEDTENFLVNLEKYATYLAVLDEFLEINKIDSMTDLNNMVEECMDVSALMMDVTGPKSQVMAVSSTHHDVQELDCHVVWGYDNLNFPVTNENFTVLRSQNRPISYRTEDGEQYVKGTLTQKALAGKDDLPFM